MTTMENRTRQDTAAARPDPSSIVLVVMLAASALGALSLLGQQPQVAPPAKPPLSWSVSGHDAARTGHSLSYPALQGRPFAYPTPLPIALIWRRPDAAPLIRAPLIDGDGNMYLTRSDGGLLSLKPNGETRWCAAVQAGSDAACVGSAKGSPPGVAPSALLGLTDRIYLHVYAVDGSGHLKVLDPSSGALQWSDFFGLISEDGVVLNPDGTTLYGVVRLGHLRYRIVALKRKSIAATEWAVDASWPITSIASRGLTPISIAPDGTLLVAASSPSVGGAAWLYAFDSKGHRRWHSPLGLTPGRPSYVAVAGTGSRWTAWVAVARAEPQRSSVFVVAATGQVLWHWSVGHLLDVTDGGIALAQPVIAVAASRHGARYIGVGYVSSSVGVYVLDLSRTHAWLFIDTRTNRTGIPGSPLTDVQGDVYVATGRGRVYSVTPSGQERWHYDTHRDARGPLALEPDGSVLVITRTADGGVVVELLGANGTPLTPGLACAAADCFTPTAIPTAAPTATLTPMPTTTPPPTTTATALLTVTAGSTATATVSVTLTVLPGAATATPAGPQSTQTPPAPPTPTPIAG